MVELALTLIFREGNIQNGETCKYVPMPVASKEQRPYYEKEVEF